MKYAIFEEHSSSCVVYSRFSGTLFPVSMIDGDYRLQSFLGIQYVHGDLCKHLGIDLSTDHPDLFLNAHINRYVHA